MKYETRQLVSLFNLTTNDLASDVVNDIIHRARHKTEPYVFVFTMVWDVVHLPKNGWDSINKFLLNLSNCNNNIKILLLMTDWLKNKAEVENYSLIPNTNVIYLNGIALTAYNDLFKIKKCKVNNSWNPTTSKFLFLTGKWWKTNRIKLFYELEKEDLIKYAKHSLFLPAIYSESFTNHFSFLTRDIHKRIYEKYNCNVDNTRTLTSDEDSGFVTHHIAAIPFDFKMYEETSFRLISETEYELNIHNVESNQDPWITEKTWIPIFNKHPFIMAGQKGSLQKLKSLGFRTFENYLPKSEYDLQEDHTRLVEIVENTKFWVHHISEFSEDINRDVQYNFDLLTKICEYDYQLLLNAIHNYELNIQVHELMATTFY